MDVSNREEEADAALLTWAAPSRIHYEADEEVNRCIGSKTISLLVPSVSTVPLEMIVLNMWVLWSSSNS